MTSQICEELASLAKAQQEFVRTSQEQLVGQLADARRLCNAQMEAMQWQRSGSESPRSRGERRRPAVSGPAAPLAEHLANLAEVNETIAAQLRTLAEQCSKSKPSQE